MFGYDRGLKLLTADLAIDSARRRPRAFVSHAHYDHMARHGCALCTPDTAALYRARMGQLPVLEIPYFQSIEYHGVTLETLPAGHCLGSAMLLANDGEQSLLYTGDFKLRRCATAATAEFRHADILIIESTFGNPAYRFQPRELIVEQLVDTVQAILKQGKIPLVLAYALGKAQEVTRILTDHGIRVMHHPEVFEISKIYNTRGMSLGDFSLYRANEWDGHAVISPPRANGPIGLPGLKNSVRVAVTGWAMHGGRAQTMGASYAVPLSDHADFDELIEAIGQVDPKVVYCTHGPREFVDHVRAAGYSAHALEDVSAAGLLDR